MNSMDSTKGKIGLKELVAIIILNVGTKVADNTPTIFYEAFGTAAWIGILIIGLISLIPILLITKLITLYQDKNLIDIILHLFGKHIGFVLLFTLCILQIFTNINNTSIYTDIIGTMYFSKTPTVVIYLLLLGVAAYGAKKGIEYIGSSAWVMLFWICLSLLVILSVVFVQGEFNQIFPILGTGGLELVKGSYQNSSILMDFLYLALIASNVKSATIYKKGIWIGFVIILLAFVLSLIGYVMLFDYYGVRMFDYPYHETIRYIEIGFLNNVELLFFPFWLISSFIRFAFYLYLGALLFGAVFKIKQFEYVVPALAVFTILAGLIPESSVFSMNDFRVIFLNLITPIFLLFPCLLWITAKLKGDFKNE
ncbi:GerAB/ArcD/ProY family transporter [Ureibacillus chungkukjangi]|uniref:Spore germination protein (Amino acid permease) n=2 Tax=Ureibacillus chungkukjangi TaxID=1202712 RepID=A0A318TW64_9BACL|nr:endospore germination permease [Ureibacillus chungkukjangi]PYF06195.1 spore germination protein (amino acid permease) [Ureibacillus chungkukjangi]